MTDHNNHEVGGEIVGAVLTEFFRTEQWSATFRKRSNKWPSQLDISDVAAPHRVERSILSPQNAFLTLFIELYKAQGMQLMQIWINFAWIDPQYPNGKGRSTCES
jgi:hypothetical protein